MNNLKQFTARELTSKHAQLMDDIEKLPPGIPVSPDKIKAKAEFEEELQSRLYSLLLGDVLPVIPMVFKIAEKKLMIAFHFEVLSMINTRIGQFKIDAPTKKEAWKKARKKAMSYSGDVHLKIK